MTVAVGDSAAVPSVEGAVVAVFETGLDIAVDGGHCE